MGSEWGQRLTILVLVFLVMAIFEPAFFKASNSNSILLSISIYGIMACGMFFAVLLGGMDLCVGSMAALSGSVFTAITIANGYTVAGMVEGLLSGLLAALAVGILHGVLVAFLRLPSFVVTLATKYLIYGAVMLYTGGKYLQPNEKNSIYYMIGNARPLGIPMPVYIFIIYALLCVFILNFTVFGRQMYAVGGNPVAAELMGIKSKFSTVLAYVISSISAGIGGMILVSMNMQAGCNTASGYEGSALTAMVVGGINLAGGEGGIAGAVFGALLVGIINNMLILLGIPYDYQTFIQGIIIIIAVTVNVYSQRKGMGLTGTKRVLAVKK